MNTTLQELKKALLTVKEAAQHFKDKGVKSPTLDEMFKDIAAAEQAIISQHPAKMHTCLAILKPLAQELEGKI